MNRIHENILAINGEILNDKGSSSHFNIFRLKWTILEFETIYRLCLFFLSLRMFNLLVW